MPGKENNNQRSSQETNGNSGGSSALNPSSSSSCAHPRLLLQPCPAFQIVSDSIQQNLSGTSKSDVCRLCVCGVFPQLKLIIAQLGGAFRGVDPLRQDVRLFLFIKRKTIAQFCFIRVFPSSAFSFPKFI
ncbi:hypothetical protein CHARACLAT_002706 [Characodon lateralis]|uniref:Uncharacterized protein n=1 Tax=Characodon lateralis TaxID=208331 RepID=A0ABU7DXB1_9TELE|nr:hypothetical protein [Characodon lateralis]